MRLLFIYLRKSLGRFFSNLVAPRSKGKDSYRKEFILNVLLLGTIFLSFWAFFVAFFKWTFLSSNSSYQGFEPFVLFFFFVLLIALYLISRIGKFDIASYLIIALYFFGATYTSYLWGVDLPQGLLIYALVIVMSGILMSSRFAFAMSGVISLTIVLIGYLQQEKFISVSYQWRTQPADLRDALVMAITLGIIAIISWLSNREIEKSLKRARASERELKKERDQLEIKVEERTRELKRIQLEKVTQLYRFAEVGKLTSGFMHDLANPISLISLNLHKLNRENQQKKLAHINVMLKRAMSGTRYLENFITSARKQLQNQDLQRTFSLNSEIKHVIQILNFKANKAQVKIVFEPEKTIKFFGNPIKLNQVAMNLILNAIDAYEKTSNSDRLINIMLDETEKQTLLIVQDFGVGISKNSLKKIFDPFFSTKTDARGTGIGLSITQSIVKQSFHGTISVKSNEKAGTIFIVKFPKRYPKINSLNERD